MRKISEAIKAERRAGREKRKAVFMCRFFHKIYDCGITVEQDKIKLQAMRIKSLRHIEPNTLGRLGLTWDGQTFRNHASGAVYGSVGPIVHDPIMQKLDAICQMLIAAGGHMPEKAMEQVTAQDTPPLPLPTYVSLNTLMKKYSFSPRYDKIALGETVSPTTNRYELVIGDMADFVHVIISGRTGFGKSVELESLAKQLVIAGDCDIAFVDYGVNTFGMMAEHAAYKIADTPDMAIALFRILVQEMHSRREKMAEYPQVKKLDQYNKLTGDDLRSIVVFCDEAPSLFGKSSEIRNLARDLTGMGRKFGVGCVFGGTDFKVDTMPSETRGNCGLRMAMRLEEPGLSRSIIRSTQAVNLNDVGRALALLPGVPGLVEMQCPIVERWEDLPPKREQIALNCAKFAPAAYDDPSLPKEQRVILMHKDGMSDTAIAGELWHANPFYIKKVRGIISQNVVVVVDDGDNNENETLEQ